MKPRIGYVFWAATAVALAAGLLGWGPGVFVAIVVTALHAGYLLSQQRQPVSFAMQVRLGFLGMLVVGQLPYLEWIHWIQLIGVSSLLTFGYCPLARLLALMPWNSHRPMNWALVRTVLLSPPVRGSILEVVSPL